MSLPVFGKGRPRRLRPLVETTPRICARDIPASQAREGGTSVRVVVNGAEMALDMVHEPCNYGGDGRWFFLCGTCSKKVLHLYLYLPRNGDRPDDDRLVCRKCAALTYRSQHTRRRGLHRARNLRRKLGALPGVLSPIPPRPLHWRRDYWVRALARLAAAEGMVAAELRAMIPRVRRRLKHDRDSAGT